MSKKGGGSSKNQTVTTTTNLPPEVTQLINLATPYLQRGLQNYTPYSGPRVASMSPDQTAAITALRNAAGGLTDTSNQAQSAFGTGLSYLSNPLQNPALGGAIDAAVRPIQQQFLQTVLPNIRTSAVTNGQYGGSRQDLANNLASQTFLRQVGDTSAGLTYDAWNKGLTTGLQTLAMAPQVQQMQLAPAAALGQAGTAEQDQAQAELNAQLQAYYEKQLGPFMMAQSVLSSAAGIPGGSTSSTGPGQAQPSVGQRVLGGGAAGAAIGSMIPAIGGPWGAGIGAILSLF